jgi:hypothetical protein
MFLISGLRPTTGVYISIFKVDLAGNKRLIELGYGMDITTFNLLFKLQIYSRYMKSMSEEYKFTVSVILRGPIFYRYYDIGN